MLYRIESAPATRRDQVGLFRNSTGLGYQMHCRRMPKIKLRTLTPLDLEARQRLHGSFRKLEVLVLWVLIIRIYYLLP